MKTTITVAVIIVVASVGAAFGQGAPVQPPVQQASPMYDTAYRGPVNYYGQPIYTPPQQAQQPQNQQQPVNNGLVFQAASGLGSVGSYLWSYMPAPVRGAKSPYEVPPGQGQVMVNFVPGAP